jgi:aspartyl protease family protein
MAQRPSVPSSEPQGPWSGGSAPRGPNRRWIWLLIGAIAVGGGVAALVAAFPETLEDGDNSLRFVHGLILVTVLGSAVILGRRFRPGLALRHAVLWIALGAVLFVGYGFKGELAALGRRLMGELLPHKGAESGGEITFRADKSGQFVIEARVNGTPLRFLVDTGASDVMLSPRDAKRLGFDLDRLRFDKTYRTANGSVRGAPVRLRDVRVGPIRLTDVRASVNPVGMGNSLLGMSFLGRLRAYSVSGDRLTLSR